MDWSQYLVLARRLAESEEEADRRTAISRAYYAAFCAVRDWLKKHQGSEFQFRDGSTHKHVWDTIERDDPSLQLGEGSNRSRKQAALVGRKLKRRRVDADYKKKYPDDLSKDVKIAIREAERIFSILDELTRRAERGG